MQKFLRMYNIMQVRMRSFILWNAHQIIIHKRTPKKKQTQNWKHKLYTYIETDRHVILKVKMNPPQKSLPCGTTRQINASKRFTRSDGSLYKDVWVLVWVGPIQEWTPVSADSHGLVFALQTNEKVNKPRRVHEPALDIARVFAQGTRATEDVVQRRYRHQHNL